MMGNVGVVEILNVINTVLEKPLSQDQAEVELSTIGVDSIIFIRIIVALEETFELEIPDEKLLITEMNTLSKIVDVITAVLNGKYENDAIGI